MRRAAHRSLGPRAVALASVLAVAIVGAASHPARADDSTATAEALFQQARALVDAGRYAEACPKLEQSYKLEPAVGTQFNLADCYEHVGRTATAYASFRQVAGIARAAGKFERERSAKERAAALEPRLPRLRILMKSSAPGLEVRVDGVLVDKATWSDVFPVDPGPHRVRVSAPGRTPWEGATKADDGRIDDLTVPELVDPNPKTPAPMLPPAKVSSTQRTIAVVTGGVGLIGLGVGAVAGAVALSQRSSAERACPSDVFHFRCPTEEGASAWSSAGTAGNVSTVAFVAGGVLLAGAAVLWFTAPSSRARIGTALGGVHVEGSF